MAELLCVSAATYSRLERNETSIELEKFEADKLVVGQTTEYTKQLKNLVNQIVNRDLT